MKRFVVLLAPALALFSTPSGAEDVKWEGAFDPARGEWQASGAGRWTVKDGAASGKAPASGAALLATPDRFQGVGIEGEYRCDGACKGGVILRAVRNGARISGLYVSFDAGDLRVYNAVFDTAGREISRTPLPARGPSAAGAVNSGVPGPTPEAKRISFPPEMPSPTANLHAELKKRAWNSFSIFLSRDAAEVIVNQIRVVAGNAAAPAGGEYGPVILRVAGEGQAQFRGVRIKDLQLRRALAPDTVGKGFRKRQLTDLYFGDTVAAGDINGDGKLDLVSGPFWYEGPDFEIGHAIYDPAPFNPAGYANSLISYVEDFNGDGAPDIFMVGQPGQPGEVFINPRGESRNWARHIVIDHIDNETTAFADIDGDGRKELVIGRSKQIWLARPDPSDATKPWRLTAISEVGDWGRLWTHGLGQGDVNGDGRPDIVFGWGWWEQPERIDGTPWRFHPVDFLPNPKGLPLGDPGGAQIYVEDVNKDGLPDIITSLEAHGWGLAWYEQKKGADGARSFVRHMIMGGPDQPNDGVSFSELHALTLADVDGDGLKDIVTGKRWWVHPDGYSDPDPNGPAVLYWFKASRKPDGGMEFLPRLIHNNSGIGTQIVATDLNGDGRLDVATAGRKGIFIFTGTE